MKQEPVFIKAIPRSGGTLFTTMLDAHREIAMSYEIYEDNLFGKSGIPLTVDQVLNWLEEAKPDMNDDLQWIKQLPDNNLRVFLYRARRGGLEMTEIMDILKSIEDKDTAFETSTGRLSFIEALMQKKAQKQGKTIWGGKTQADLYELHDRHPDACFCIMRRDPRDMFASMQNRGSFTYTARQAAELWRERILEFRRFIVQHNPKAMEICYEDLARDPGTVLTEACRLIGTKYDPGMLDFHKQDMTLFKNPHGHLSNEQLQKGLNTKSIGRWKTDLSAEDADAIMAIAGDMIDE